MNSIYPIRPVGSIRLVGPIHYYMEEAMQKSGVSKTKRTLVLVLVLVVVGSVGAAVFFYRQAAELKRNPQKIAEEEVKSVVDKVGQLIVLPEGETPTVATVADPEKLKDQAFFSRAKVGDKVLIYTNAKKAILYDPVANKIVEVAPLNIGNR